MKKTIVATVLLVFAIVLVANAQDGRDRFMVQVDGLGCPFCAYGLEKKFKEFKGIKDVKIDIETGDFSFSYPSEKGLSMEKVTAQVEKAGYTPIHSKIVRASGDVEESSTTELMAKTKDTVTKKVMVAGNCGMCEARIIKAVGTIQGISDVSWDKNTKLLAVSFNSSDVSLEKIEKEIATAGHDTKSQKATSDAYNNLPACCQYERLNN